MTMEKNKADDVIRYELCTWNIEMQRLMFKALRAKHLTEEEGNLLLNAYVDIHLTHMLSCDVIFSSDKQLDKEFEVIRYKTIFENHPFEIVNNKVSNLAVKYHFDDTFSKQHHQNKYPKTFSSSQDEDSDIIYKNLTKKRKWGEVDGSEFEIEKVDLPDMEILFYISHYLFSTYKHKYIPHRSNPHESDDESDKQSDYNSDYDSDEEF